MKFKSPLLLFGLLLTYNGYSQQFGDPSFYLIDSLNLETLSANDKELIDTSLTKYHKALSDSDRFEIMNHMVEYCYNDDVWPRYNEVMLVLSTSEMNSLESENPRSFYQGYYAASLNNKGYDLNNHGKSSEALELYKQSLEIQTELNDLTRSFTLNNIALIYEAKGDIQNALDFHHQALQLGEKSGNKISIAMSLNNLGYIYKNQGDTTQALNFYNKSLKLQREEGNKRGIGRLLNNIGAIYDKSGNIEKALPYYFEALSIQKEIGDKEGMVLLYGLIGSLHYGERTLDSAQKYHTKVLDLSQEIDFDRGISNGLIGLSEIKFIQNDLDSAKRLGESSLKVAQRMGSPDVIANVANHLKKVYKKMGLYEEALETYELQIQMRDSVKNEKNQKAAIRQQTQYEFEKEQLIKEQEQKEAARILTAQTNRRNNLQYSLIFLGILLFFGLILGLGFIKMSPTVAEGLIFFAFLIFFEFLLVLMDPYIESWTNGEPIYKLLANALLAGAIFPAHAFFERILKKRLLKS